MAIVSFSSQIVEIVTSDYLSLPAVKWLVYDSVGSSHSLQVGFLSHLLDLLQVLQLVELLITSVSWLPVLLVLGS